MPRELSEAMLPFLDITRARVGDKTRHAVEGWIMGTEIAVKR